MGSADAEDVIWHLKDVKDKNELQLVRVYSEGMSMFCFDDNNYQYDLDISKIEKLIKELQEAKKVLQSIGKENRSTKMQNNKKESNFRFLKGGESVEEIESAIDGNTKEIALYEISYQLKRLNDTIERLENKSDTDGNNG